MKINSNINNQLHKANGLGLFDEKAGKTVEEASFKNYLADAIGNVNRLEKESEAYSLKIASGDLENIHEAMIVAQKAEVSLQYMIQVRNKVLEAYREITRMQI